MHAMLYKSGHDSAHCEDNHIHLMDFLDLKVQQKPAIGVFIVQTRSLFSLKNWVKFPKAMKRKIYICCWYQGLFRG